MNYDKTRQLDESSSAKLTEFTRHKELSLVREICEFDGKDPRLESRKEETSDRRGKRDYSAERLSRQMLESLAVGTALPSLDVFDGFAVASVRQRGASNCYEVVVYHTDPMAEYDAASVKRDLDQHRGRWRQIVGEAIVRKRVPDLVFEVLPPGVQP